MRKKPPEPPEEQEKKTGVGLTPTVRKLLEDEGARRKRKIGGRWSLGLLIGELVLERYGHRNGHKQNGDNPETDD